MSVSRLPLATVQSLSVSLPHFSLALPAACFQLPAIWSQFMGTLLWRMWRKSRAASKNNRQNPARLDSETTHSVPLAVKRRDSPAIRGEPQNFTVAFVGKAIKLLSDRHRSADKPPVMLRTLAQRAIGWSARAQPPELGAGNAPGRRRDHGLPQGDCPLARDG